MLNGRLDGPSHWHTHRKTLPKTATAARALRVPAASAPVQRVFSQGGIILKPRRGRLLDTLLSKLIVLKRNNRSNMQ